MDSGGINQLVIGTINMQQHSYAAIAAIAVGLVVAGCSPPPPLPQLEVRAPVEVETIELGDIETIVLANGDLKTRARADLNSQIPGRLYIGRDSSGERFVEGKQVEAGETIAQISGIEAELHIGMEQALTSLETTRIERDRNRRLHASGTIPEADLRNSEVAFENARIDYERAKLNDANTQVTTPISGTILKLARDQEQIPIADGSLIGQGLLIAQVAPLDVLEAYVDLIGPDLSKVAIGQQVRILHYAFSDLSIQGEVVRLSPTVDPQTHTFQAVIRVDNDGEILRPGMFVRVEIITEQRLQVPVVNREAVTRSGGEYRVFVLDGQRVKLTEVQLGLADDEFYEVIEGIKPGDRVVVRGLNILTHNAQVRVLGE